MLDRSNMVGGAASAQQALTAGHDGRPRRSGGGGRNQQSGSSFTGRLSPGLLGSRAFDQAPDRLRWLRAALHPVVDSLAVELDIERFPMRIVLPEYFDKAPVALRTFFGYYDPVKGLLFCAHSRKSDAKQNSTSVFAAETGSAPVFYR